MTSSRLGLGVAVVATLGLLLVAQRAPMVALTSGTLGSIAIPGLWAAAAMRHRQPGQPALAASIAVVIMLLMLGWREGAIGAFSVIAGLAGGWALALGWRLLPILSVMAVLLAPVVFLGLAGTSVMEASRDWSAENRRVFADNLPAGLSESERTAALADFDEMTATVLRVQERSWPAFLALGLMTQGAMALGAGWLLVRLSRGRPPSLRRQPWEIWRAPFVGVWLLIGGLVGAVSGVPALMTAGWSLVVLAGLLLTIHGLAVQTWFANRLLSPAGRMLYWLIGAVLLVPIVAGGAVLGVVDQWWDLRRASGLVANDPGAGPDDKS